MTQSVALNILKLGHTTFLTGAAGSGKSYVLREYISYLRSHGVRYAVTASTGIASTHISGVTIHSWSGIGIKDKLHAYDLDAMEEKQNIYKRWNETQVLIIDEVSMLHANFVDMLDRAAKHLRRNESPFGGIQVVFTGDFFQLPPVVRFTPRGGRQVEEIYEDGIPPSVFAFSSRAWKEAKPVVCYLTEQWRQVDDKLSDLLNAIRSGEIDEEHYELLREANESHKGDHIKLYTHNENVDQINQIEYKKIKGDSRSYTMTTKGKANVVESLKNSCLAEENLELKIGAKVICLKNSPDKKYVNGSMGTVVGFDNDNAPIVELVSGKKITVNADTWRIEEDGKVRAEISQIPLKLAWAITVHKSQGMTLDRAEIDLSRSFASGQGYVALSRLKGLKGLYLKGFNPNALMVAEEVREADKTFQSKSDQAETAIEKYSKVDLEEMQNKFLTNHGGSLKELDEEEAEELQEKIPSHTKTEEMIKEGLTIKEIGESRKLSTDTIIGHIEKLIESGDKIPFDKILPDKKDVTKIKKAFKELETDKLTPVYEFFKGKYSYQDIRLVRASLKSR
ncbi:MAG: ATPase [Candidatus Nomurabacteria bacterium]|nr:ATPase [Candidatus Nomurabacteria bacterium]